MEVQFRMLLCPVFSVQYFLDIPSENNSWTGSDYQLLKVEIELLQVGAERHEAQST